MNSVPPPPGRDRSARKPGPEGDGTEPPKKKRYWWRFSLASVIIIAVSAAATSSAVLLYINSIADALGHNKVLKEKVEKELVDVNGGEPETILILGSDIRANSGEERGRSDTTILLRLDAEKKLISVMSIPRDLQTEIPGVGTEKFNAAYTYGGPKLTLQVIKELTGLKINHVINIDFLGFVRAVDAIGCVYTDVDRRYYHSNVGLPAEEQYSEINIQPGYQKLCGVKALQYVRYRHTDTDIVRSARQQNFLSQARHQVSPTDLITDNHNLVDILTEYTTSDITGGTTLITLLDLLFELRGAEVNQVHFPAELGPSFVYASEEEIHHAVKEFLGEAGYEAKKFPEQKEETALQKAEKKKEKQNKKKGKGKKHKKKKHTPPGGDELVPASELGEVEGEIVARHVGGGFPVFYPSRLPEGASFQESNPYEHIVDPRVYHLKDKDKERHAAYRMVAQYQPEYEVNYFGVQGIRGWEDPPILDDPTETKSVNGREYSIYTDSGKIKIVAWHRGENSYWISNSLQQSLSNEQMMGIAESCHLILPKKKTVKKGSKGE
ncbi:MAG TPA: LCP family protein [Solirubrobacterales bacterium]|nr:LCP family protein [Solirubrobacterales bacterium]